MVLCQSKAMLPISQTIQHLAHVVEKQLIRRCLENILEIIVIEIVGAMLTQIRDVMTKLILEQRNFIGHIKLAKMFKNQPNT